LEVKFLRWLGAQAFYQLKLWLRQEFFQSFPNYKSSQFFSWHSFHQPPFVSPRCKNNTNLLRPFFGVSLENQNLRLLIWRPQPIYPPPQMGDMIYRPLISGRYILQWVSPDGRLSNSTLRSRPTWKKEVLRLRLLPFSFERCFSNKFLKSSFDFSRSIYCNAICVFFII